MLARLLDLNQKRYAEEVAAGPPDKKGENGKKKTRPKAKTATESDLPLFAAVKRTEDL